MNIAACRQLFLAWMSFSLLTDNLTLAATQPTVTKYTEMSSCQLQRPASPATETDATLVIENCPSPVRELRLQRHSADARSWLSLKLGTQHWTTAPQVVYGPAFGFFPAVTESKIEWHLDSSATHARALIFRVFAQNTLDATKTVSRLFVYAFRQQQLYFCGITKTNEEASRLAETPEGCSQPATLLQSTK